MKFVYLFFIVASLSVLVSECMADQMVVFEYDAAGNRIARYITEKDSADAGALRMADAFSDVTSAEQGKITIGDIAVSAYPNPTSGPVVIDVKGESNSAISLEVFSSAGAQLQSKDIFVGENIIDLSSYPNGQYIVVVSQDAGKATSFKVVKK